MKGKENAIMELSGTLSENLRAAINSARRLRGKAVHRDTLDFWRELLEFARTRSGGDRFRDEETASLIADLDGELASRAPDAG